MSAPVQIAYCFDAAYAPYAAVSTFSLMSNRRSPVEVHWCVPAQDAGRVRPVAQSLASRTGSEPCLVPLDASPFSAWKPSHHIPVSSYLRLALPQHLSRQRLIYLDADTLVLGDLGDLYSLDLGRNLLGGVPDPAGAKTSRVPRQEGDVYVNSGVLLLELDRLRSDGFFAKCQQIYAAHEKDITWLDQCILNKYAEGRKLLLPAKWNRQIFSNRIKPEELRESLASGAVLHFVGDVKPWQEWCNPGVSELWWSYARKLGHEAVQLQKIKTIHQALSLASSLDMSGMFEEASKLKGNIIRSLMKSR